MLLKSTLESQLIHLGMPGWELVDIFYSLTED